MKKKQVFLVAVGSDSKSEDVKILMLQFLYVPDNGAHSQEIVINGAPALLVAVGSKPTDEQHHEDEDLQKLYLVRYSFVYLICVVGNTSVQTQTYTYCMW